MSTSATLSIKSERSLKAKLVSQLLEKSQLIGVWHIQSHLYRSKRNKFNSNLSAKDTIAATRLSRSERGKVFVKPVPRLLQFY